MNPVIERTRENRWDKAGVTGIRKQEIETFYDTCSCTPL
jgi:hypothetical protein